MSERPTPEQWFHRRATHYVEAQALFHLNQVGVFEHLDRHGSATAEELAARLGLVPEILSCLLFYVAGVDGILEQEPSGAYGISDWGQEVLARYGKEVEGGRVFNFFDVRVGAYGPVWSHLDKYMRGEVRYGDGLERRGEVAADAVYKVTARLEEPLRDMIGDLDVRTAMEVGVTTGLLMHLAEVDPGLRLVGLDRKADELVGAQRRAQARGMGDRVQWMEADLFDVSSWASDLNTKEGPGVLFSVHFHEFLAVGLERMQTFIRDMAAALPGWVVVAMEQPLLPPEQRGSTSEVEWLYNHSNVLIHHLIGNGRILSDADWRSLLTSSGGHLEMARPLNYLGYHGYAVRL